MTEISLKEAISFAFKKVRENFFLFLKLGTTVPLMVIGFIVLSIVTAHLVNILFEPFLKDAELAAVFVLVFIFNLIILGILTPIFTLRVVSVVNAGLIRISFKLINNESTEFKDVYSFKYFYSKLDEQTKKFSVGLILLAFPGIFLLPLAEFSANFIYPPTSNITNIFIFFIIWFILFSRLVFFGHLIIDKNLGIKESFKKSFILTRYLMNNLGGLFRLLVLSIFQLITFLSVFIVLSLLSFFDFPYKKLSLFSIFFIPSLIIIISFITPILFLITSYFYKRLIDQVEEKNLI
jgi:hypothetical protein